MLSVRFSVTSRKFATLILEEISILYPKNLKVFIIFFYILEHLEPSLLGRYNIPSLFYNLTEWG